MLPVRWVLCLLVSSGLHRANQHCEETRGFGMTPAPMCRVFPSASRFHMRPGLQTFPRCLLHAPLHGNICAVRTQRARIPNYFAAAVHACYRYPCTECARTQVEQEMDLWQ